MDILIEHHERTNYEKGNIAIENSFSALLNSCKTQGIHLDPVMGLMYLSQQKLTRDFQESCRVIINFLGTNVNPEE